MRVSVVLPTFDRPELLGRAIGSALEQSLPPVEIVVCDDGQSDVNRSVVEGFGLDQVRYLPGPHTGGPALPRNRGIAASSGDWIALLDDDDTWHRDKLEQQARLLAQHGGRAASARAVLTMPDGSEHGLLGTDAPTVSFRRLLRSNDLIVSSVVLHRSLMAEVGPFQDVPIAHEDYSMWLRVATVTDFANSSQPLLAYQGRLPVAGKEHTTLHKWALRCRILEFLVRDEPRPEWNRRFRHALAISRLRQGLVPIETIVRRMVPLASPA